MSREWAGKTRSAGWVMRCDAIGCQTEGGRGDLQQDLPLTRFVAEGWFIAHTHGDLCPACVQRGGGLPAVIASRRHSGAGRAHQFMGAEVAALKGDVPASEPEDAA